MNEKKDTVLTSVRLESEMYDKFKLVCLRYKFTLHKLVERSIFAYTNDEEFRKQLHRVVVQKKK
jgi:hypothetical protein